MKNDFASGAFRISSIVYGISFLMTRRMFSVGLGSDIP
jgi:hypothetical protein